jgi:hypothetical protein
MIYAYGHSCFSSVEYPGAALLGVPSPKCVSVRPIIHTGWLHLAVADCGISLANDRFPRLVELEGRLPEAGKI